MRRRKWTDDELIKNIQSGNWNDSLRYIFFESGWRESVQKWILKNSGSKEDAEDILQVTLTDFAFQIRDNNFRKGSALFSYFFSIGKNKWLKELAKRKRRNELLQENPIEKPDYIVEGVDFEVMLTEKTELVLSVLHQLGEGCKKTLLLFGEGYRFKEIAQKLGLKNADAAKNKKYRCSHRFFEYLEVHPEIKKMLKE